MATHIAGQISGQQIPCPDSASGYLFSGRTIALMVSEVLPQNMKNFREFSTSFLKNRHSHR
jgi:hypothetical protein